MSKQAKGTVNVWLPSGAYTKASDLHKLDDERLVESVFFHVSDPAPARCVVTTGRDNKPIHIGGAVSRTSASPYAGYGPHRRPPLARRGLVAAVSAVGSVNVLMWVVGIVAALILMTACSGPSDLEAERATAAALQDAIAQAQAERPDLWAPETIERAKTAALIAAAGRK